MEEPKTIARYRLTGELGRGGMGVVYRAEDPQLGRPVAVKVILFPPQATDDFRSQLEMRFEREARSAAGIRHPGVVTVHDFGRDGDYLFLVMELIEGESLADRLKTGWLPERAEAFDIAARVADALAAAHAAGVVHRDVTPRNILVARDDSSPGGGQTERITVTDFGIARSVGEETYELTRTGMLVGSPSFMAPEQVRGQDFDGRADVFSLGVVLYQLLTGKLPFQSNDLTSLLYQIVHEDPFGRATPDSTEIKGKLGQGTVKFLQKCLAKEPADRIQKATEFAREARRLRAAVRTAELEETVALGAIARERAGRDRARHGRRLLLAAALIAATVIGAWSLYSLLDGGRRESGASAVARTPETAPSVAGESPASAVDPAIDDGASLPATEAEPVAVVGPETDNAPAASESGPADEPLPAGETPAAPPAPPQPVATPPTAPPERQVEPAPVVVEPADAPPRRLENPSPAKADSADLSPDAESPPAAPVDIIPPVLDIDGMPRELTASEVVLAGRVMDDGDTVELTVDGDAVAIDAEGGFVTRRPLAPGRNALAFVAVDAAGNRTMKSIEVSAPVQSAAASPAAADPSRPRAEPAAGPGPGRQRFADRGDGTLLDTVTRITWTKRAEDNTEWKASKGYCKKLELGRHRDWVLPTIEELEELYLTGVRVEGMIWSSTRKGSGQAWAFDFVQGQRGGQPVAGVEGIDFKALCLRRERPRNQDQDFESPFGPIDSRSGGGGLPSPPGGGGGGQQQPPRGGGGGGQGGGGGGGD